MLEQLADMMDDLAKGTKRFGRSIENFVDLMPTTRETLIERETQSSEKDGLDYTEEEIEKLVEKQLENHPVRKDLETATDGVMELLE